MKPVFMLLFAFSFLAPEAHAAEIVRGPYAEITSDDSAVIKWRTDTSTVTWIEYGYPPACNHFMTLTPAATRHEAALYGLQKGVPHCYRVYLPVESSTSSYKAAEGSFRTLYPPEKRTFEFLAFGNSSAGGEEQLQLASVMAQFDADFALHTGNLSESGLDVDADVQYFDSYKNLLLKMPFFIALGINEYGQDKGDAKGRNFLKSNFTAQHRMPYSKGAPNYYSFETAHGLFIALDTNSLGGAKAAPAITPKSEQVEWLKTTLAKSRASWKFVFMHHPAYSTGAEGSNEELIQALSPMFEQYRVDLVFQGHDSDYERTYPIKQDKPVAKGGVIYVTLGGGGHPVYAQNSEEPWSEKFISDFNFARVRVNNRKLRMEVYNNKGEILDTLEMMK